jgi:tetratricopeptide (TPR) repeat protein
LAIVKFLYEWDWKESEILLRLALELNPSSALAHRVLSYLVSSEKRHGEAIVEAKRACELDPVSLLSNVSLGVGQYLARQYDEAIATLRDVLDSQPTFGLAMKWLGAAYSARSMHSEAIRILQQARQLYGQHSGVLGWLGAAYATASKRIDANKTLEELAHLSSDRYVSAFDTALIHVGLEQTDESFQYLEKAFEEHCPFFGALLEVDPRLDGLRSDPRYHSLVRAIRA